MWQGVGCLMTGCGGYHSVRWVRRAEVGGGMDNDHSKEAEQSKASGGYLVFNLGVLGRGWDSVVV